jgi:glycosyltransferase involved in cell wall biosynthesis
MERIDDEHKPEGRAGRHYGKARRHCMVVHAYYPIGETRVEREAKALLEGGIEVDVICLQGKNEPDQSNADGIGVHRLPVRRHRGSGLAAQLIEYITFFLLASFRLTKLHWRKRYDVVQVHNLPDFLVFTALIPKLMGAKVILDLHDLMPEFYAERYERSTDSLLVRIICWQEALACRFADAVITVTELWRQTLIRRGQPADKVNVVMNVADDHIFYLGAARHTPDNGQLRLIYHGVLGYRHGLDLILRAMNQIQKEAPDIHLTLHGPGEYRQALETLADELGLQSRVLFSKTALPTTELPELLMAADLAIVPYRDGVFTGGILPTKMMEYAALGIPVIAARTPAIDAYFDDATVLFFTPNEAGELASCILALYRDRARLADFARNIVAFNERYNWAQVSAEYVALVEHLGSDVDKAV